MRQLIICLGLLTLLISHGQAREPMVDPETLVPVELATVGVDPFTRSPVVILREPGSGDMVPISIGPNEAMAITRALGSVETPRPMTHDTMVAMLEAMGGRLERIMVDGMTEGTYFGVLDIRLEDAEDTPVYVDTRPSDALAMAVRTGAGILVAPEVLQATRGRGFQGIGEDQVVTAAGITVTALTESLREELDLPELEGVIVLRVGGSAQDSGLQAGAVILSVNGEETGSALDFLRQIQATPVDQGAQIRFWADGEEQEVTVDTDVPQTQPERRRGEPDQQFI